MAPTVVHITPRSDPVNCDGKLIEEKKQVIRKLKEFIFTPPQLKLDFQQLISAAKVLK